MSRYQLSFIKFQKTTITCTVCEWDYMYIYIHVLCVWVLPHLHHGTRGVWWYTTNYGDEIAALIGGLAMWGRKVSDLPMWLDDWVLHQSHWVLWLWWMPWRKIMLTYMHITACDVIIPTATWSWLGSYMYLQWYHPHPLLLHLLLSLFHSPRGILVSSYNWCHIHLGACWQVVLTTRWNSLM